MPDAPTSPVKVIGLSDVTTNQEARAIVLRHLLDRPTADFAPIYVWREGPKHTRIQPEPVRTVAAVTASVLRHASHWDLEVPTHA